ncbi:hypothetical protein SMI01S_11610 [Sphingobacterium mizutaii NBRC 14946 = DSM 11724]|uniref:Uncharacterized protein n=2 Tax=Sphingobacterium mizutaii TaxID=1010 RepID=A0AAJ4XDI3_9SPHI|nr:hypothetical protein [Sphingobacterium mizutaii]GEM67555.1 hypothetical protein SMI01S_11610 [Sphingobacterium mizutaii NBRC 14946 = DSM 11724]SDL14132.1 hypothetical protein SAMN05192578_1011495 [Sphingobacterium mizutaii]SNV52080.1 Uncharacterised protein [Sphingobacterium mizutaii]
MLLFDEIPQPITWYDEFENQSRFLNGYEKHMFELLVQKDRLLPFQVRFPLDEFVTLFEIYDNSDALISRLDITQLKYVNLVEQEFNYYLWPSDYAIKTISGQDLNLPCGKSYYLKLNTNYSEYYSELFVPIDSIEKYLMIEWSEEHNVDPAYYLGELGFRFRFFVDTFITKGIPSIIVESDEDGHGEIIDISRKVSITYDIDFGIIPNFIYEAIAFMAIHRDIIVTTPKNLREGSIINVSLEETQIDDLSYWHLVMNFQQGRYYYNTACGHDIQPPKTEEYLIDQGATQDSYDSFIEQEDLS